MVGSGSFIDASVHDARAIRRAGAGLLGLALMDARNRTLAWLSAFDELSWPLALDELDPPLWCIGHAGWYQEYWVARHVQRGRGEAADPAAARLASIEPMADRWFDPQSSSRRQRWAASPPDAARLRAYLAATLDASLDLLAGVADRGVAADDDRALHVFRLALDREDRIGEALAVLAQALDLAPERWQPLVDQGLWPDLTGRGRRDALVIGGQQWRLGSPPGGWVPPQERWAHDVAVADYEIDAQPVSWAQFAEFAADGAYDERRWWSTAGWDWIESGHRRAPRYVEQLTGAVLARRQGRLLRLPGAQSAVHVSAHEAQAWCQWAGRRLPIEAEWEMAATLASARGFAWGEQLEWTAGSARAYPGGPSPDAGAGPAGVADGVGLRVLRGATVHASPRLRHPRARRYAPATGDELFAGFRSCAP